MIAAALRPIASRLNALTPRERGGLAMLAAILTVTAAVYAADWAGTRATAADIAAQAAANAQALRASFDDEAYVRRLSEETANVWRSARIEDPLADDEMLAEIEALCAQAGLSDVQVALIEGERQGLVSTADVSINAGFDWTALLALLETIEYSETSISVRSIEVTGEEGAQELLLIVSVPLIDESALQ